jgi:hypothetical protein
MAADHPLFVAKIHQISKIQAPSTGFLVIQLIWRKKISGTPKAKNGELAQS